MLGTRIGMETRESSESNETRGQSAIKNKTTETVL